jgi:hypothetical protein
LGASSLIIDSSAVASVRLGFADKNNVLKKLIEVTIAAGVNQHSGM